MPVPPRNNPFLFLFLFVPQPSSLFFLNRGFTWPRVCPAVITCIMHGAVGLCKKGLIDGPGRRGAAEGSLPSSVGPDGGAKTLSRNRPAGGMSIETTGTRRFTFLHPFLPTRPLSFPCCPRATARRELGPPFNTRSSSARQIPRSRRQREENFPIVGCLRRVNIRVH